MSFDFLLGHSNALDEFNKPVAIALRRNWRDLATIMGKSFEEVFQFLHGPILSQCQSFLRASMGDWLRCIAVMHLHVSDSQLCRGNRSHRQAGRSRE